MDPFLLIFAAALSGLLVVYSVGRRNRTTVLSLRAVTRTEVRRHLKLDELDDPSLPEGRKPLVGAIEGFPIRLDYVQWSSPGYRVRDERSSDALVLRVQLSSIYAGVTITAEPMRWRRGSEDVEVGDHHADHELLVHGPERRVLAIMGSTRRVALRQCVRDGFEVDNGALQLRIADSAPAEEIVGRAQAAVRFARRIDVTTSGDPAADDPPEIAVLLAHNVLHDPLASVRRRNAVLLFTGSHASEGPVEVARTLLAEGTEDFELKARAAAFLRDVPQLLQLLAGHTPLESSQSVGASVALRALATLPLEPEPEEGLGVILSVLTQLPADGCTKSLFGHAARAIQRRQPGGLNEDVQRAVIAAITRFPSEAGDPLCSLLANAGSPFAIPLLTQLPRSLRRAADVAVSSIQARTGGESGALALADAAAPSSAGGLSDMSADGDYSAGALTEVRRGGTGVWAVVPAKAFVEAKSRLAGVLDFADRARLAASLLSRLLDELGHCRLDGIMVATASEEVADVASRFDAEVVLDGDRSGVSAVVGGALEALAARGARTVIVVMADLPLFDRRDCALMLDALNDSNIVVAPDRRGAGANAVAVNLPVPFELPFGRDDSFQAHCERAQQAGLQAVVHQTRGASLDLDTPDDLALWQRGAAD